MGLRLSSSRTRAAQPAQVEIVQVALRKLDVQIPQPHLAPSKPAVGLALALSPALRVEQSEQLVLGELGAGSGGDPGQQLALLGRHHLDAPHHDPRQLHRRRELEGQVVVRPGLGHGEEQAQSGGVEVCLAPGVEHGGGLVVEEAFGDQRRMHLLPQRLEVPGREIALGEARRHSRQHLGRAAAETETADAEKGAAAIAADVSQPGAADHLSQKRPGIGKGLPADLEPLPVAAPVDAEHGVHMADAPVEQVVLALPLWRAHRCGAHPPGCEPQLLAGLRAPPVHADAQSLPLQGPEGSLVDAPRHQGIVRDLHPHVRRVHRRVGVELGQPSAAEARPHVHLCRKAARPRGDGST